MIKSVSKVFIGLGIALSAIATLSSSSYGEQKFYCDEEQMSTVIDSHWGKLPMIRWSDRSFPPPWTPLERCKEVTKRFNRFNSNGTLKYMSTGTINNHPIICVAGYEGGDCLSDGLLITLKKGRDPNTALTRILDRRVWATSGTVEFSSGKGSELISEAEGKIYVNVDFLLNGND